MFVLLLQQMASTLLALEKTQYSCWPVFVIPLNLPPALCMKEENIFLSLMIPGPEHPGMNLNVFMRPLVDEMKEAWMRGVLTYDSFSKKNFNTRVSYHTSIHGYPALGMFSGWSTHGGLACFDCMADVDTTWLPNGRKFSWFDCHRRFLPPDHSFRDQRNAFRKGVVVRDMPPHRLTGQEVLAYMNEVKANSFDCYGVSHNWTHIPPPGFCVSTSPTQSPENAATHGSAVREETPDETISRIANGVFRSHDNATASGGGNYSPQDDDFPLY